MWPHFQAQLPEMKVADATHLVSDVAAVKSELELEAMRQPMEITDLAVRTFQEALRGGITEEEIASAIEEKVRNSGGRVRSNYTLQVGERLKLPHGLPTNHPIANNEGAMIEIGGVKHGYSAGLVRGAVLGKNQEIEALHDLSSEALDAAISTIKPGVTAGELDAAARRVITQPGRPRAF